MLASHAVRSLVNSVELSLQEIEILSKFAHYFLVKGVKIGGIYRHFKGKEYLVTGVVRDSSDWSRYRVEYLEITDASHRASRFLDEFLGLTDDGKIRFELIDKQGI
jgi:hypothetical protein